jgi:hypothetical protein
MSQTFAADIRGVVVLLNLLVHLSQWHLGQRTGTYTYCCWHTLVVKGPALDWAVKDLRGQVVHGAEPDMGSNQAGKRLQGADDYR